MTPKERTEIRETYPRWDDIHRVLDALDEAVKRIAELEAAFAKADDLLEAFRADISSDDLSDEAYESWCEASKFVREQGGTQ